MVVINVNQFVLDPANNVSPYIINDLNQLARGGFATLKNSDFYYQGMILNGYVKVMLNFDAASVNETFVIVAGGFENEFLFCANDTLGVDNPNIVINDVIITNPVTPVYTVFKPIATLNPVTGVPIAASSSIIYGNGLEVVFTKNTLAGEVGLIFIFRRMS